jgi:chromosome segregation ATPase
MEAFRGVIHMVDTKIRSVCKMMEKAIKMIAAEIASKERRIQSNKERIRTLESQPHPDLEQIKALKKDIRALEQQLESDRSQLAAFEEEFSASCRD